MTGSPGWDLGHGQGFVKQGDVHAERPAITSETAQAEHGPTIAIQTQATAGQCVGAGRSQGRGHIGLEGIQAKTALKTQGDRMPGSHHAKSLVPTRTSVAPSSTAIWKSCDMPMLRRARE